MINQSSERNNQVPDTTRAAAEIQPGGSGISLQAPLQLKLEIAKSYKALKAEEYFNSKASKKVMGNTEVNKVYTVLDHYGNNTTQIAPADLSGFSFWVKQRSNIEDLTYYSPVAPELYKKASTDKDVDGNDPQRLLDNEVNMFQFPPNWQAMPQDPHPFDAQQGQLTDCSLICSLSGVANSPHYSKKLKTDFDDTTDRKKVRLYHPYPPRKRKEFKTVEDFKPQVQDKYDEVDVDMVFPVQEEFEDDKLVKVPQQFLYAQPDNTVLENVKSNNEQAVWPMVYESGLAKKLGMDYTKLDDREVEEDLSTITGVEPLVYDNSDILPNWDELVAIFKNEGIITGTTFRDNSTSPLYDVNFPFNHAYTFITITNSGADLYNQQEKKTISITKEQAAAIFEKLSVVLKV
ncbi:MAG: C2 family cysteine protease [Bacteroidia bacterium]